MKRALKIILVLILIAAIVVGILWLIARHKAAQSGTIQPSFKDFFTRAPSVSTTTTTTPDETGSDFTNGNPAAGENDAGGQSGTEGGTINGSFTNGTIAPTQSETTQGVTTTDGGSTIPSTGSATGSDQGGIVTTGSGASGSTTTTTTFPPASPSASLPSLASCTEAETHIAFTADELAQLDTLSKQFYSLAQTLHSDADVASAQAAFDSFNIQNQQLEELIGYFNTHTPSDPQLSRRVDTPFWNASTSVYTLIDGPDPTWDNDRIVTYYTHGTNDDVTSNETRYDILRATTLLQRFLRPSLW